MFDDPVPDLEVGWRAFRSFKWCEAYRLDLLPPPTAPRKGAGRPNWWTGSADAGAPDG